MNSEKYFASKPGKGFLPARDVRASAIELEFIQCAATIVWFAQHLHLPVDQVNGAWKTALTSALDQAISRNSRSGSSK